MDPYITGLPLSFDLIRDTTLSRRAEKYLETLLSESEELGVLLVWFSQKEECKQFLRQQLKDAKEDLEECAVLSYLPKLASRADRKIIKAKFRRFLDLP